MTPADLHDKDVLIAVLVARIEVLAAANAALTALVADLEAKLGLPPKTPDNSSVPPSKGQKPSDPGKAKAQAKPHAGAHRHCIPTRRQRAISRLFPARAAVPTCQACRKTRWQAMTGSKFPRSSRM